MSRRGQPQFVSNCFAEHGCRSRLSGKGLQQPFIQCCSLLASCCAGATACRSFRDSFPGWSCCMPSWMLMPASRTSRFEYVQLHLAMKSLVYNIITHFAVWMQPWVEAVRSAVEAAEEKKSAAAARIKELEVCSTIRNRLPLFNTSWCSRGLCVCTTQDQIAEQCLVLGEEPAALTQVCGANIDPTWEQLLRL